MQLRILVLTMIVIRYIWKNSRQNRFESKCIIHLGYKLVQNNYLKETNFVTAIRLMFSHLILNLSRCKSQMVRKNDSVCKKTPLHNSELT